MHDASVILGWVVCVGHYKVTFTKSVKSFAERKLLKISEYGKLYYPQNVSQKGLIRHETGEKCRLTVLG